MAPSRPTRLHAAAVRAWAEASLAALGEERAAIDALNVFPGPDGDTGTNMFLTVESACAAIEEAFDRAEAGGDRPRTSAVASAMARGALLGARGNSGVILAQIVRGVASVLGEVRDGDELTGAVVARALRAASDGAYSAVSHPIEGTILTVARAAADAADLAATTEGTLVAVIESAVAASHVALAETTDQLPALRDAGVVDAGGQGLVVVYDALLDVVTGVRRRRPGVSPRAKLPAPHVVHGSPIPLHGDPSYEVMYIINAGVGDMDVLRRALEPLGDSLMVTGDDRLWNVHVHVHDAGAAIEAGLAVGTLERIRVTYLAAAASPAEGRGLVVVTHGPGTAALVAEHGAVAVAARPRRRPSTAELLDGIRRAQAAEVVVLPSDSDSLAVAEAAAEQARGESLRVSVIPARSIVQSLAALAVHDPGARFDDDVIAMTRAVAATRYAAVTIASKDALTMVGPCREGDVLGLAEGDIVEIGSSVRSTADMLVDRLVGSGGELLTVVRGAEFGPAEAEAVVDDARRRHPGIDIVLIDGGQPLWPVILGVE
jgi:DAK2 domain fusion protein YloV